MELLWLGPTVYGPPVSGPTVARTSCVRTYCGSDLLWLRPPVARISCVRTYCGSDLLCVDFMWLGSPVTITLQICSQTQEVQGSLYNSTDQLPHTGGPKGVIMTQQISSQTQEVPSCFSLLLVVKQIARIFKIMFTVSRSRGTQQVFGYLTCQVHTGGKFSNPKIALLDSSHDDQLCCSSKPLEPGLYTDSYLRR